MPHNRPHSVLALTLPLRPHLLASFVLLGIAAGLSAEPRQHCFVIADIKDCDAMYHAEEVLAVAVSPDGRRAISGGRDATIKYWDLRTGRTIAMLEGHEDVVRALAISPDGRRALSGGREKSIKYWDLEAGREIATLAGHDGWISSVAFSPDGRRAISGSWDATIRYWDLETGETRATLEGHEDWVLSVAFSPDGRHALSGGRDTSIRHWDLETGETLATLREHDSWVLSVAISPDGRHALSGSIDNSIRYWNLRTRREIAILQGHDDAVLSVAISPDGRRALSGGADNGIRYWDLQGRREIAVLNGHTDWVRSVAISPDGRRALSASNDTTIKYWDLETEGAIVQRRDEYNDDIPDLLADFTAVPRNDGVYLFVIGIEEYRHTDDIDWSRRSAEFFVEVAKKTLGIADHRVYALYDSDAGGVGIDDSLDLMLTRMAEERTRHPERPITLLFYYSGHGVPAIEDNNQPYIMPYDRRPANIAKDERFRVADLYRRLSESAADRIIAFMDSCFTGRTDGKSIFRGRTGSTALVPKRVTFDREKMAVITAGTNQQFSNALPSRGHRLFSYWVMKSLLNGRRTVDHLYSEVSLAVHDSSRELGGNNAQDPVPEGNLAITF